MCQDKYSHNNGEFYKRQNFWLETSGDDLEPRASLNESITADVAILGAGFSGLWIAYYLIEKDPTLNIVILEKEITGFGASGRNGGWCSPKFSVTPEMLMKRYGNQTAKDLQQAMFDTVDEVERVIETEGMNVDWKKDGMLQVALGNYNVPVLKKALNTYKSLGFEDEFELMNQAHMRDKLSINRASGGLFTKKSAVLHPGKLVRQMANMLERKGVKIYEQTEVTDFEEGNDHKDSQLITKNGAIAYAKKAAILSGEAYLSQLKKFRRKVIPTYSLITLTEPLTEDQWAQIGWKDRVTVSSTALSVHYLQKTADGRILFGGRGAPYHYGSKIKHDFDYHKETHQMLKQTATDWFPPLAKSTFTHSWGGPVGMSRDWMPNFTFNKKAKLGGAWGYVGQGVSTANLAGRILSDMILERDSAEKQLPMVQHHSKKWEPEPFRWIGARYVQAGMEKADKKSDNKRKAPTGKSLSERLSRH